MTRIRTWATAVVLGIAPIAVIIATAAPRVRF